MLNAEPKPLPARMYEALARLQTERVDGTTKGMPGVSLTLGDVGAQGWNVLCGDLPLPQMLLKREALAHNIALMQAYCDTHGASLAPHGKTPMSPQIWAMQLQAGAWGISISTIQQFEVAVRFGVPRILIANQVVGTYELNRIAGAATTAPAPEIYLVVDSLPGLERVKRAVASSMLAHPLGILVEYGIKGGRAGVRDLTMLLDLGKRVRDAHPNLRLAGIFGYEGIAPGVSFQEREENAERYLLDLKSAVQVVHALVPAHKEFVVSAGGSVYFDRVVAHLGRHQLPDTLVVLRPGAYVTHDSAFYERISPLAKSSPRFLGGAALQPALEIWSHVLSRPEPELVILGMGGRDAPSDLELPTVFGYATKKIIHPLSPNHGISRMNDQHAFLRVPPDSPLAVGDMVVCGISHPCTSFDKWRQLFVVNRQYQITDVISTFF